MPSAGSKVRRRLQKPQATRQPKPCVFQERQLPQGDRSERNDCGQRWRIGNPAAVTLSIGPVRVTYQERPLAPVILRREGMAAGRVRTELHCIRFLRRPSSFP